MTGLALSALEAPFCVAGVALWALEPILRGRRGTYGAQWNLDDILGHFGCRGNLRDKRGILGI